MPDNFDDEQIDNISMSIKEINELFEDVIEIPEADYIARSYDYTYSCKMTGIMKY